MIWWIGDRTRYTVTMSGDGLTQVARQESSADGVSWTASMDVTLRKVALNRQRSSRRRALTNDPLIPEPHASAWSLGSPGGGAGSREVGAR